MTQASNSVGQIDALPQWLRENWQLFRLRLQGRESKQAEIEKLVLEIDAYQKLYEEHTKGNWSQARVFEVGYGARPLRLLLLSSMGIDARGIDLDAPSLRGSGRELAQVLLRNGPRRFAKTLVRSLLFDRHERNALKGVLHRRGKKLTVEPERFLVGDVADCALEPNSVDLIYSEDVFEHIPGDAIDGVCAGMHKALRPGGIALITPLIYSSIQGGHLVEWYGAADVRSKPARSDPWEHLRQRRFRADCFLNEWRLSEYQSHFERHFEVLSTTSLNPDIGRGFLSDEILRELSDYDASELLGNKWRFVLRKPMDARP